MDFTNVKSRTIELDVKDRIGLIGGSDVGAHLGVSKFRTPLQAFNAYMGIVEPEIEADEETQQKSFTRMQMGTDLEQFVADQITKKYNVKLRKSSKAYQRLDAPWAVCHPDRLITGFVDGKKVAVEIKTSSAFSKEWGTEESNHVPESYRLQCLWYKICGVPCDEVWLVCFKNNELIRYVITLDNEELTALWETMQDIVKHYENGDRPNVSNYKESLNMFGVHPKEAITANSNMQEMIKRYRYCKAAIKEQEAELKTYVGPILEAFQGKEILEDNSGNTIMKLLTSERETFQSKKFKEDYPELFSEYVKVSTVQSLR